MKILAPPVLLLLLSASLGAQREVFGSVSPWQHLSLRPAVSGQVREVVVDVGDRVKKGQILVELDAPGLRNATRLAETAVALAEIAVRHAELERKLLRSEIASHVETAEERKERLPAAAERVTAAANRVKSVKALFDAKRASSAEVQQARAQLDEARERVLDLEQGHARALRDARNAELVADRAGLAVDAAKARLKAAQVELDQARYELDCTRVRAPYAGTITSVACRVGAFAKARESTLLNLEDSSRVRVTIGLNDDRGGQHLKNGMEVQVTRKDDDFDGATTGKLHRLIRKRHRSTAEVTLPNDDGRWIVASQVRVRLPFE